MTRGMHNSVAASFVNYRSFGAATEPGAARSDSGAEARSPFPEQLAQH